MEVESLYTRPYNGDTSTAIIKLPCFLYSGFYQIMPECFIGVSFFYDGPYVYDVWLGIF